MPGQTFTTYINAKRSGSVDAEFAALEQRAGKTFSGIQAKADAASRSIAGLAGGRGVGGLRQSPITQAYLGGFDQAKIKADRMAEASARLAREQSALVRGLRTTGTTLQVVQGPLGPIAGRVSAAADAIVRLTGVTLGLGAAGAALFAYTRAANQFVEIRSKLAVLYDSQKDVNAALADVYGIAQRARAGLDPVVDLYSRLKLAADQYGFSQERVSRITELATKAATLSGGTQQSRESGLYQFAQGFGSGTLGGDELKSIKENTLALARAISIGLGKLPEFKGVDTSIGKLKVLGEQGKLTADVIARALEASAGDIETRFARLPPTLGMAFTSLSNSATMFIGKFEQATGIVGTLASGVMLLGNNLNVLVSILGGVATAWAAVAAVGKVDAVTSRIGALFVQAKAQQSAARSALALAVDQRNEVGRANIALMQQGNQIRANIVALEAELAVQQEIAAQGSISARAGLPGGAQQAAAGQAASKRITRDLANEVERLSVVQVQAAGSASRMAKENAAVGVAMAGVNKTSNLLKSGLVAVLSQFNFVGIAVAAATTAFLLWATAESEAEKNARKIEDAQRKLATVIDFTTGKIIEQNAALLAGARTQAGQALSAADTNYTNLRRRIGALGVTIGPQMPMPGTGLPMQRPGARSATEVQAQTLIEAYGRGQGSAEGLARAMEALAKVDPSLRKVADQVNALAADAVNGARDVAQLRAQLNLLAGASDPETVRRANRDFSGGQAQGQTKSDRDLIAESEALRKKLRDQRFAAEIQQREALEALDKRKSKMTEDDYVRERAQIGATYDTAIANLDKQDAAAQKRSEREEARRQKAHERELARIEIENQRRDRRTETRQNILGNWNEGPKAVVKATRDIGELNDLIGKTMNGLTAITENNPLGQGIYTAEMAATDAQHIEEGLQRPYDKYMEARQRDMNVSKLLLAGHDLEAAALQQAYDLYDQIGSVTMDQYSSILNNLKAEEQINDALAKRERLLAPLRESVGALRSEITGAIEDFLGGGSPLKGLKNIVLGTLKQFNHNTAVQLAESITGGLDARVRDLIRGSVTVDGKIADYINALDQSGSGADNLTSALNKAADAATNAAAALQKVGTGGAVDALAALPASAAGAGPTSALYSLLGATLPQSFYKPGASIGSGVGDNILFQALGSLGAVITDNLRPQSRQNAYYSGGLSTARVSDHTTTNEAWDVRLPAGMSFQAATNLVRKTAQEMGYQLVKALDETASGGTGRHAHYVFGQATDQTGVINSAANVAGSIIGGVPGQVAVAAIKQIADVAQGAGTSPKTTQATITEDGSIVVTGTRKATSPSIPQSPREQYNLLGQTIGTKLDALLGTKFLGKVGSVLGNTLAGIQYGTAASGVAGAFGLKQSKTGAAVGGAIGSLAYLIPGIGPIAGPIASALGGIIGGTLGGLLKKPKYASATISGSGGIINVGNASGSGGAQIDAAGTLAGSVGDALQQIADQLGATIGNFAVSIGVNKKGKYVVDETGQGKLTSGKGVPDYTIEFKTEEEAVRYAIMNAIKDGAITGLSAASQTILRKAKDLTSAMNKVMVIESIPKRLLALTDPVRAAVEALNTEFAQMIAYLKEGGATAAQFAQAQQLYDLERQQAVTQAAQQSISAIKDFIAEMLGGSSSPLNKQTVYENANTALQPFIADIQAGKPVDSTAFLKAVQDFEDASKGLYGSSQSFFSDFDYLLGLLQKAQTDAEAAAATGTLPPSPFDDPSIQALIAGTTGTTDAINNQTAILGGYLAALVNGAYVGPTTGSAPSTAIAQLPSAAGVYQ